MFSREYEEEISLLQLKIQKLEGFEKQCEEAHNEKKILDEKYDNLLKNYQNSLKAMEAKIKEVCQEKKILNEKFYYIFY